MKHFSRQFKDLEKIIHDNSSPGIRPGLDRIERLLRNIGNPQDTFRAVHVVGTNGKGSTTAFLSSILMESGYRVATYTSPHLKDIGERTVVNSGRLPFQDWEKAYSIVSHAIDSDTLLRKDRPSFFEIITAISFLLIKEQNVDLAIIEAGLGGRLDATNTLGNVILSIITSIAMDHSDFLGNDIFSIAEEKFSVIRNEGLSLFYGYNPSLEKRYVQICKEKGAKSMILSSEVVYSITHSDLGGNRYTLRLSGSNVVTELETRIPGLHQVKNSALAVLASLSIKHHYKNIDLNTIRKGILVAEWPGRMEIISRNPVLMLDGAHNEQGIHSLIMSLESIYDKQIREDLVFIYTSMADKDYEKALFHLSECGRNIILTTVPGNQRCATTKELLTSALLYEWAADPEEIEDPIQAISWACARFPIVIVCGSLYLVGYVKKLMEENNDLF